MIQCCGAISIQVADIYLGSLGYSYTAGFIGNILFHLSVSMESETDNSFLKRSNEKRHPSSVI